MNTLFVSPHFDDVALSCGGVVALVSRSMENWSVSANPPLDSASESENNRAAITGRNSAVVATIFAAPPPGELNDFARFQHDRWRIGSDAVDRRREEDRAAMDALGADYRWLDFPDAIYRGDRYRSDDDLFGPVKPTDAETSNAVVAAIVALAREIDGSSLERWRDVPEAREPRTHRATVQAMTPLVYLPLGVGGHVDHCICHAAAEPLLAAGFAVRFYEDLPYACNKQAVELEVGRSPVPLVPKLVDVTAVFERRLAAIAAYASQLPTIFRHYGPWEATIRAYAASLGPKGCFVERFWRVEQQE